MDVTPVLLAAPNVSEGRDLGALDAIATAFSRQARLLDLHADPDHHRAVFTLAGAPGSLAGALLDGARVAVGRIDLTSPRGHHPHVGAIDVVPIVHLSAADRGAACAEALVVADLLGRELELPVFLYGVLADGRTRADLRRGGVEALASRIASGELRPDFGPRRLDPAVGAVLVAARAPLVAFNVELAPPADLGVARTIAAQIREGGSAGLPSLRAIGIELGSRGSVQVSMNVDDPEILPLATIVAAIDRLAAISSAEIVGLAPLAALAGFPAGISIRGFDADRQIIENALH